MIYLKDTDVLLFQGDSITHGNRIESDFDMNHVIGHGYQDLLAQKLGLDNIERMPQIHNRGISGDTVQMIAARADKDIFALKPTILSILVGVNNGYFYLKGDKECCPEKYDVAFRKLLDDVVKAFPSIKLIIGQPFRYFDESYLEKFNRTRDDELKALEVTAQISAYAEQIAKDYGAVFVRFKDALDSYVEKVPLSHIVWDGIHPTYVGHGILAECWLETVEKAFEGK